MVTPTTETSAPNRKAEHIALTQKAQVKELGPRSHGLDYEPLFGRHPLNPRQTVEQKLGVTILGKRLKAPIWISSMTGGTPEAQKINQLLARVAGEYGLGMGLGSCRPYLHNPKQYAADFEVRSIMGDEAILFANLGIAQIEELLQDRATEKIESMIHALKADGLIVHLNPLQEWFQPEGDVIKRPALETLQELLEKVKVPVMVKEVGQGMGPRSLKALLEMPLVAIDFAAFGGTNFSYLELLRQGTNELGQEMSHFEDLACVGHDAQSMVKFFRKIQSENGHRDQLSLVIVSGGIGSFLEGYRLTQELKRPAVYAYAKRFLDAASQGETLLRRFVEQEIHGLAVASEFLVASSGGEC
jgi:isopentenyl-diphosphate Delta-isomerase